MAFYQIQARVIYDGTAPQGWESSGRSCPTFRIEAVSPWEAAKKTGDVLNPYRISEYRLIIIVMNLEDDDAPLFTFRNLNRDWTCDETK